MADASQTMADIMRLVDIDHPEQRIVQPRAALPHFMRLDLTHELPIVLFDAKGKITARFADAYDASSFIASRFTQEPRRLPAPIVMAIEEGALR